MPVLGAGNFVVGRRGRAVLPATHGIVFESPAEPLALTDRAEERRIATDGGMVAARHAGAQRLFNLPPNYIRIPSVMLPTDAASRSPQRNFRRTRHRQTTSVYICLLKNSKKTTRFTFH